MNGSAIQSCEFHEVLLGKKKCQVLWGVIRGEETVMSNAPVFIHAWAKGMRWGERGDAGRGRVGLWVDRRMCLFVAKPHLANMSTPGNSSLQFGTLQLEGCFSLDHTDCYGISDFFNNTNTWWEGHKRFEVCLLLLNTIGSVILLKKPSGNVFFSLQWE
jgi:hypothetical protein